MPDTKFMMQVQDRQSKKKDTKGDTRVENLVKTFEPQERINKDDYYKILENFSEEIEILETRDQLNKNNENNNSQFDPSDFACIS